MTVRRAFGVALVMLFIAGRVDAQSLNPGPPGPFVFDVRGSWSALPVDIALYPDRSATSTSSSTSTSTSTSTSDITTSTTSTFTVPSRGFGLDVGGHVYPFRLGPSRVGLGASVMGVRGTAEGVAVNMQIVAPQLSFNFGTANGWSYLSAGGGPSRIKGDVTFTTTAVNAGGGARWFMNDHTAIGFDIRIYRLSSTGSFARTTLFAASVGLSLK